MKELQGQIALGNGEGQEERGRGQDEGHAVVNATEMIVSSVGEEASLNPEDAAPVVADDVEEDEDNPGDVTCNPMVSSDDDEDNDESLRGDRIGSTTYSQRHVLKLLIKWVQELPKYSLEGTVPEDTCRGEGNAGAEAVPKGSPTIDRTRFLEPEFEEEMSILWDMSYEPDVINFLVEQNIFNMIRQTLDASNCSRFKEVALGVMANILSEKNVIEDFSIIDASLALVETVIADTIKMSSSVPVLIQEFAVFRRITWFLRSIAPAQKWIDLLLSRDFLTCGNFVLSSSTNALLLSNVVITMFTLLEALSPEQQEGSGNKEDTEETSNNFFGNALENKEKPYEKYRVFCETLFVSSLCEGLKELMKDPKPKKTHMLTSTRRDKLNSPSVREGEADSARVDDEPGLDDLELPIPDGLVQTAILNGLTSFHYLLQTLNGKDVMRKSVSMLLEFLVQFFKKFPQCTDSVSRASQQDYLALALNILSFCHKELEELSPDLVYCIPPAAIFIMNGEEDVEDEAMKSSETVTFVALVVHEHLASIGDTFGHDRVTTLKSSYNSTTDSKTSGRCKRFFSHVDEIVARVAENTEQSKDEIAG